MNHEHARIILDVIEAATEVNWPHMAQELTNRGYTGPEVEAATGALAEIAHRDNPISADDFFI